MKSGSSDKKYVILIRHKLFTGGLLGFGQIIITGIVVDNRLTGWTYMM
jgi:hypothetical protein